MRVAGCVVVFLVLVSSLSGQPAQKPKPEAKKLPPQLAELFKLSPEEFIRRFDKDKDGMLSKEEVPPFLRKNFEAVDTNGDGKLDTEEVARMLQRVRMRFGLDAPAAKAPANPQIEKLVANFLQRLDANKDGKISQEEAKGRPLAKAFARFDKNKDGFLDRSELRAMAAQNLANAPKKGPIAGPAQNQPDFDALDADADGRLTRAELKGSPLLQQFDQIDTNRDGRIDRREFEAFLKRQARKAD